MPRSGGRAQPCDRSDALNRLLQAEAFVTAAALVLEDGTDVARPGVAAALAVLAGIAASDAACCARLGADHAARPTTRRPRCSPPSTATDPRWQRTSTGS